MADNKIKTPTAREQFTALRAVAEEHAPHLVAFIDKQIGKLDKKSATVDTKKLAEHRKFMDCIVKVLAEGGAMKCGDIAKAMTAELGEEISPNKALAMIGKMLPADEKHPNGTGEVVRFTEKKDIFFKLA